jgi:hypothetical protein
MMRRTLISLGTEACRTRQGVSVNRDAFRQHGCFHAEGAFAGPQGAPDPRRPSATWDVLLNSIG